MTETTDAASAPPERPDRVDRTLEADGDGDQDSHPYGRLRDLIVQGQLAPGSPLIEAELADRLEVSRSPVRSALQRLQQEGFLQRNGNPTSRSRPVVAPLSTADAREIAQLLGMIEGLAARRGAGLPEEERRSLVAELDIVNRRLHEGAGDDGPEPGRCLAGDAAFHRNLVGATVGPRLQKQHRSYRLQMQRYARFYLAAAPEASSRALRDHQRISRAVESGEPEAAESAARECWRATSDRLGRRIRAAGERGNW